MNNNNLLSQINNATCLANTTNKIKYKNIICSILAAELYAIIYRFDIKK